MFSHTKRSIAAAALVLAAGLGLTACGSDDPAPAPGETSTTDETAAPDETTTEEPAPDAGEQLSAEDFVQRMSAAQLAAGTAHVEYSISGQGQDTTMSADMALDEDPNNMAMIMNMEVPGAGDAELRLVDGVMYMNLGDLTEGKFVEMSLDDDNPMAEQFAGSMDQMDPSKQLEVFSAALEDFSVADGTETIDGVETTQYTLTLNMTALLEAQGVAGSQEGMPETVSYDMYVGPDDLPRRIAMDVAGMTTVMDFSRWGEPVTVEAPPADQITDGAALGL